MTDNGSFDWKEMQAFMKALAGTVEGQNKHIAAITDDLKILIDGIRSLTRIADRQNGYTEMLLQAVRGEQRVREDLKEATWDLKEGIRGLKEIAESHERRLHRLEGGEEGLQS